MEFLQEIRDDLPLPLKRHMDTVKRTVTVELALGRPPPAEVVDSWTRTHLLSAHETTRSTHITLPVRTRIRSSSRIRRTIRSAWTASNSNRPTPSDSELSFRSVPIPLQTDISRVDTSDMEAHGFAIGESLDHRLLPPDPHVRVPEPAPRHSGA